MATDTSTNPIFVDTYGNTVLIPGRMFIKTVVCTATAADVAIKLLGSNQKWLEWDMAADETKVFVVDSFIDNLIVKDGTASTTKVYIYHS